MEEPTEIRVCARCGAEFAVQIGRTGSSRKYCSDECRRLMPNALRKKHKPRGKCLQCGASLEGKSAGNLYCSAECQHQSMRRTETHICQQCGVTFVPKARDRGTFCSRECSFAYIRQNAQGRAARPRELVGQCEFCGEPAISVLSKTCHSDECQRLRSLKHYIARHPQRTPGSTYVCRECGKEWVSEYGDKRRFFCSFKCSQRWLRREDKYKQMRADAKRRRRARKYGNGPVDQINALAVYERDGWRCGICGKKVNRKLKHPHPLSVSLDHIVALAKGGTHTIENVQCSHLICNSYKRDIGTGQLRLKIEIDSIRL